MSDLISEPATLKQLIARIRSQKRDGRMIVALVGPPGSGKSTLADHIVKAFEADGTGIAAILPMDGFHYDDHVLKTLGRHAYKGAPDTFDVGGLRSILQRIAANDEPEIAVPVFDRDLEISRGSARTISSSSQIIIVEGNWLLLNDDPWSSLRPLFDITVMIEVPETELRRRLSERWQHQGLSPQEVTRKVDSNDLPNARRMMRDSSPSDLTLSDITL